MHISLSEPVKSSGNINTADFKSYGCSKFKVSMAVFDLHRDLFLSTLYHHNAPPAARSCPPRPPNVGTGSTQSRDFLKCYNRSTRRFPVHTRYGSGRRFVRDPESEYKVCETRACPKRLKGHFLTKISGIIRYGFRAVFRLHLSTRQDIPIQCNLLKIAFSCGAVKLVGTSQYPTRVNSFYCTRRRRLEARTNLSVRRTGQISVVRIWRDTRL